jgi:cell wall-associated NlpC family hydrolase
MAALFVRADEPRPGDILLVARDGKAQHLAVCSGEGKAIHAQIRNKAWVRETPFRVLLHRNSLDSVWRWRDG